MFLLAGKWLGNRQIRCNWATKGANADEEKQSVDTKVDQTNGSSGEFLYFNFLSFPRYLCGIILFVTANSATLLCLTSTNNFK